MKKNKLDVARAWRDEDYFLSLTEEERASLGAHPAGISSLEDEVLKSITGGCACTVEVCSGPSCNGTVFCTPCGPNICRA